MRTVTELDPPGLGKTTTPLISRKDSSSMKLLLSITVPLSATPEDVKAALHGAVSTGQGITIHTASGLVFDVDLTSVANAEDVGLTIEADAEVVDRREVSIR